MYLLFPFRPMYTETLTHRDTYTDVELYYIYIYIYIDR